MASWLSAYVFPALLALCVVFALKSIPSLPENVAIHFNAKNEADAWVSRDHYRILILLSLIGLPLVFVFLMAWLPKFTGGKGQVPDCEYWFVDERRDATERFLMAHALWLGCFTVAVIYGIHVIIQRAFASGIGRGCTVSDACSLFVRACLVDSEFSSSFSKSRRQSKLIAGQALLISG